MSVTQELPPPAAPPAFPPPPPVSSTPPPPPAPVGTFLVPPPVRTPEPEAPSEPVAEPLFTVKVWQLGFAVIVLLAVFYVLIR